MHKLAAVIAGLVAARVMFLVPKLELSKKHLVGLLSPRALHRRMPVPR